MSTDVQWERLIDLIVQQLRQKQFYMINTAWKVSKYGVFPGQYVLYSDWIQENTDQKKLRIWHFSRSKTSHLESCND